MVELRARRIAIVVLSAGSWAVGVLSATAADGPTLKPTTTNRIGMKFVLIPAGKFEMGRGDAEVARHPEFEIRHEVTLTRPFYLAAYEVTRQQFQAFVDATGYRTAAEKEGFASFSHGEGGDEQSGISWLHPGFEQTDEHPVVCVSWYDAIDFCDWLKHTEGLPYRLPTESEWEYACRAGDNRVYTWGNDAKDGAGSGNFADLSVRKKAINLSEWFDFDDGHVYTAPVGSYRPNRWGLYDMLGNACEWCLDRTTAWDRKPLTNPLGGGPSRERILRGGSWDLGPSNCRPASRGWSMPHSRFRFSGFRVLLELPEASASSDPTSGNRVN